MITEVDVLKDALYERISEINDEKVLLAIQTIVDNIKNIEAVTTPKRDLTSYVNEWVKNI